MISSSYIWSWHIWFSYEQPFLYLRSYVCVPIFIHGINGLPISVHRIIGFLMNGLPIIAFLYLRSYDCVFLYPCLPVERGGSLWKDLEVAHVLKVDPNWPNMFKVLALQKSQVLNFAKHP